MTQKLVTQESLHPEHLAFEGKVRVRIAPSPTGALHVGTARTALFNWLFARKHSGSFVLRIEDTDAERSSKEHEKDILDGLGWLGLRWDEGPDVGGLFGPYRQSERTDIYRMYLTQLFEKQKAYWCYCTQEELKAQQDEQMARGEAPRYSGKCGDLGKSEIQKLEAEGRVPVLRFRMPAAKLSFKDMIRGKIEFDMGLVGDIVIAKSLDAPLYNFAAVVDDATMEITHVIRGEDHIANTPKQRAIQEALGFSAPVYAHLPLLLGKDRSKLSKRHGATSVTVYRDEGYLSEALVNFMALLGWNPDTEQEIFGREALIDTFNLEKVQKGGAVFNTTKLQWMNGQHMRSHDLVLLTELAKPFFKKIAESADDEFLQRVVALQRERARTLKELAETSAFFFKLEPYPKELLIWKERTFEETIQILTRIKTALHKLSVKEFKKMHIEHVLSELVQEAGTGEVYWPMRAALSGLKASPGPLELAEAFGKKESIERLGHAHALLQK